MVKKTGERKKHAFVPFNDRVASIKIDPVRRVGDKRNAPDAETTGSYFAAALEKWLELDLTANFTQFARTCRPLAQSLPLILYNQKQIAELLLEHLKLVPNDHFSAESIFDLVANFARDLGADFEPYFAEIVKACIKIIEACAWDERKLITVEQAFNCLAYLFKYLSRLLTTNLVPTYSLISPLFGREKKQRSFVARFAAESIAFLIRRCSGDSLRAIVEHIVSDSTTASSEQYHNAAASLLADTLLSTGNNLHSKAPALLHEILLATNSTGSALLVGDILVIALHFVRRESAGPLYTTTLEFIAQETPAIEFCFTLLFILAGLRKGDRVSNWVPIYDCLLATLEREQKLPQIGVDAVGVILALADFGTTTKYFGGVHKALENNFMSQVRTLELLHRLNEESFSTFWGNSLARKSLGKADRELLAQYNLAVGASSTSTTYGVTPNDIFGLWWNLAIVKPDTAYLKEVLKAETGSDSELRYALSGTLGKVLQSVDASSALLDPVVKRALQLPLTVDLIKGLRAWITNKIDKGTKKQVTEFVTLGVSSCDKLIREQSLMLLKALHPSELFDQCLLIDSLPYDISNARNIGLRIRNLAQNYATSGKSEILDTVCVRFFFGLLSSRFMPVWKTALEVVPKLAEKDSGIICTLAHAWIEHPDEGSDSPMLLDQNIPEVDHLFECTNLTQIQETANKIEFETENVLDSLHREMVSAIHVTHYPDLRSRGIKTLAQIPRLAERAMAADLVPYLLIGDDEDSVQASFSDRMELLGLFSKFRKVTTLERYEDVYDRLLYFLGSKHLPLQKLALQCLLALQNSDAAIWRKYRESLEALLDESRLSDELTTFLTPKAESVEGGLHEDDTETIMTPVLRILYGRAQVAKAGNSRRRPVLTSLHKLESRYVRNFIELAVANVTFDSDQSSLRKQQGLITLVNDMLKELKTVLIPNADILLDQAILPVALCQQDSDAENKALRQAATKTVENALSSMPDREIWDKRFPSLYARFIAPQLGERFGRNNLEQPSSLMHLFMTLTAEQALIRYAGIDDCAIIRSMCSCLGFDQVKESVVSLVLKFVQNIVSQASAEVANVTVHLMLANLPALLDREYSAEVVSQAVNLLKSVLAYNEQSIEHSDLDTLRLIQVCLQVLGKAPKLVPTAVKAVLLESLSLLLNNDKCPDTLIKQAYVDLARLFRQFSDRNFRTNLASCYRSFGQRVPEFSRVGNLITELNAFDARRLGQPDFERRLAAFAEINEKSYMDITDEEWLPLVYSMLYMLRDPEELALRNNALYSLKRLVDAKQTKLLEENVLPELRKGLRDSDDKFRKLYIELFAHVVRSALLFKDCQVLLFGGDEEADFFYNITHMQVHRRRRAVQRLRDLSPQLTENSIAHYLLPIIEHFVELSGNKDGELNNLAEDSLECITALAKHLSWNQYRAVARRYVGQVVSKPQPKELRKNVKLTTAIATSLGDNPAFTLKESHVQTVLKELVQPLHDVASSRKNEEENLPDRIPLAVPIALFLKALGPEVVEAQLPGKLTSLAQLLRSKTQEIRDNVRQTLGRVIKLLGPHYLAFMLSELQSALRLGAQLHILGYTVHSLLVELGPSLALGDLDGSVSILTSIIIQDTFGSIGDEKDTDGYTAAAKEVKQQKSYDSAEILASNISLSSLGLVLEPIQRHLLYRKVSLKTERRMEELLKRISAGLHKNAKSCSQDGLVMCYQVYRMCVDVPVQANEAQKKATTKAVSSRLAALEQAKKESEEFFKVRLSSRHWDEENNRNRIHPENMHVLQSFVLNSVRYILGSSTSKNSEQDSLLSPANVKGLMPIILESVFSDHEDLQIGALRLATQALRIPMENAAEALEQFARRAIALIHTCPTTSSDLFQSSVKFLTMLVRHKDEYEMRQQAISYILDRIKADIEEPDRQGIAIGFVRAILSRNIVLPQVYDIMDRVSNVMVTNQSALIRNSCRSAFQQFLLSYPHGQGRLSKYFSFLVSNLQYPAPSGRMSVLEMLRLVLTKVDRSQIEDSIGPIFAGLVLVLVNDDSSDCRSEAVRLIREMLVDLSDDSVYINYVVKWLSQRLESGKGALLMRGGFEVAAVMVDSGAGYAQNTELRRTLDSAVSNILESGTRNSNYGDIVDWQLIYLALGVVEKRPVSLAKASETLAIVDGVMLYPHPWVRARATRIYGAYFKAYQDSGKPFDGDLQTVAMKLLRQLGAPKLLEADALQIVKNVVYVARSWTESPEDIDWMVKKLSVFVRTGVSAADGVGGKTGAVQILASLPSVLPEKLLETVAFDAVLGLYVVVDQLMVEDSLVELRELAQQALTIYESSLGPTAYLALYNDARQHVQQRRRERKSKRSVEAVTNPDMAARKRLKRNSAKMRSRKEKHVKKW